MTAQLIADMSVAPEIARLAQAIPLLEPRPEAPAGGPDRSPGQQSGATAPLTLGALYRELRTIAATPERWWGLVRFEPDRSVAVVVEECGSYRAWLVILPPGDTGQGCDCEAVTMIAGEATEGTDPGDGSVLRPGPVRVHGGRHGLQGRGNGYSISLHARARRLGGVLASS
ncbi:MAG: hypothetical protein ACRDOU_11940 [Streptosporangiaceae bacterium]